MKIVVLDKVPLDQGDIDWQEFQKLGEVVFYDRTAKEDTLARCLEADVICSNKVILDKEILEHCPQLKFIQIMATGTNIVDFEVAAKQNIKIANIPSYSTSSVVQHVFAVLFQMLRDVAGYSASVAKGDWVRSPDFAYFLSTYPDLSSLHLGIVGQGEIGLALARMAECFGMKVSFASIPGRPLSQDKIPLDELLPQLDILSMHCALSDLSEGLINETRLRLLPKKAYFINTSRGPVVVEEDLAKVLHDDHLAGAALDVLSTEPPQADNPLLTTPRCLLTPHIAWASIDARKRLVEIMQENLIAFQKNECKNVVLG